MGTVTDASSLSTCDGAATIIANGTAGPFTFQWSHGPTTQTVSGLCSGAYTVVVTNAYGCEVMLLVNISVDCSRNYTFSVIGNVSNACVGQDNGEVNNVQGASPNTYTYTYLWDDGSTNNYRHDLVAGNYCVTVTSYEEELPLCQEVKCFTVGENDPQITNHIKL